MTSGTPPGDGAEPRWLNAVEMRAWRGFLHASERTLNCINAGLKTDADLTLDDYEVLVHLSEAEGRRLRMTDLADRLVQSRSRLSQRVDRLTDRGYVTREACPDDRRGMLARLTDTGFDALAAAAPGHVADVRRALIDQMTADEAEVLARVFERINSNLRDQ